MESDSSNADAQCPEEGVKEENPKCFHLFNCDETYKLDVVEKLLKNIESKLNFDIFIQKQYFDLWKMTELSDSIISELQMDFAIFVVHAHESRLSINEDNAGIGYAKIYKALLQATDGKVIIVIGGDDNYKNSDEEQSAVLSRWARRKISSQFNEEFLDGRKSFIFSWDEEHRPIHEDALLHFLDPDKKEEKFVPKPNVEPTVAPVNPLKTVTFQEGSETVKATKNEQDHLNIQTQISEDQKPQTGYEQKKSVYMQQPSPMDDNQPHSFEILTPQEIDDAKEYMDTSDECGNLQPGKVPNPLTKPEAPRQQEVQAMDTNASSLRERVAILRHPDQFDIACMMDVFGEDFIQGIVPITSSDPSAMKDLLFANSVRSCIISVEATELQNKSRRTLYEGLLQTARNSAERKVVVILHNKGSRAIPPHEENHITATMEEFLGEKGIILWWKGNTSCLQTKRSRLNRSQSCPDDAAKTAVKKVSGTQDARPINPEEFTLTLKTRLRHGRISYDANDVEVILEGWMAPQEMADKLFKEWESTANVELLVYRENKTGNERTIVNKDIVTYMNALEDVGSNVVQKGVDRMKTVESAVRNMLGESSNTSPSNKELDVD